MDSHSLLSKFHRNERVEMFSDGVFAIVVTLLVLELKVPTLGDNPSGMEMLMALALMKTKFTGFLLGFVFVTNLWFSHTVLFRTIARIDNVVLWLNNVFLLVVCFVPFPTALIGEYPHNSIAMVVFGIPWLVIPIIMYAIGTYCENRHFLSPVVDKKRYKEVQRSVLLFAPLSLIPIAVAFFNPIISFAIYVFMLVAGTIIGFRVRVAPQEDDKQL